MTAFDIVLHGATGFVGQLVADYIAKHPESHRFSWAIAGRNPDKLKTYVPFLGSIAVLAIWLLGIGALSWGAWVSLRNCRTDKLQQS